MQTETQTQQRSTHNAEAINAVDFLKSQHREVEEIFKAIEEAGDRAIKKKESLFEQLAEKLTLHAKIEESIFYPAAQDADKDLVLEAAEEHANVKSMIRKLHRIEASDETFMAKITVLKELVRHHVEEEEEELFPKCEKALGEEALLELGSQLQVKFERLESAN
jgi:hemerythrin superfamily protein